MMNQSFNTLIAGVVGSGKSYTENMIIKYMTEMSEKAYMVLIDPKKTELQEWQQHKQCLWYADCEDDIYDVLMRVYDLMELRFGRMKSKGLKVTDEPHVFCFVDEMAFLMQSRRKKEYTQMFSRICLLGRAARIHLILCTQVSTQDVIPACIRDNMINIVCLKQRDDQKYRYLLGKMPSTGALPLIGYAYVLTPSMARPTKVETKNVWQTITAQDDETTMVMNGLTA